jgi:prepilin-type N-terminal cleavage/methylation domain-containing protein
MTSTRLLLARRLMSRLAKRNRKGFTLIELLVVVVIIGILASVALPSFVGAQDKARNASVQSNGRTVQMAIEEYGTEHNGSFPAKDKLNFTDAVLIGTGTSYLPGGKLPLSPWAAAGKDQQNGLNPAGSDPTKELVTVANSVVAGKPITTENTGLAAAGAVPSTNTFTLDTYGAISYDYDGNTQYYVIYATGKKGKGTICCSSVSNAGQ